MKPYFKDIPPDLMQELAEMYERGTLQKGKTSTIPVSDDLHKLLERLGEEQGLSPSELAEKLLVANMKKAQES